MVKELIGLPFILGVAVLATPVVMALWYRLLKSAQTARAISLGSLLMIAVLVPMFSVPLRWGPNDLDSPAGGIPYFVALLEGFWIFCLALVLVLLLHGRFERLGQRRDDETDIFE